MIMDDINESMYETKEEDNYVSGEKNEETPIFGNISEEEHRKRSDRKNAGTGVNRLEPSFSGQLHDNINKNYSF